MRNFGMKADAAGARKSLMTRRDARDVAGLCCAVAGLGIFCGGLIYAAGVPGTAMAFGVIVFVIGIAVGPPPDSEWPFKS